MVLADCEKSVARGRCRPSQFDMMLKIIRRVMIGRVGVGDRNVGVLWVGLDLHAGDCESGRVRTGGQLVSLIPYCRQRSEGSPPRGHRLVGRLTASQNNSHTFQPALAAPPGEPFGHWSVGSRGQVNLEVTPVLSHGAASLMGVRMGG